MLVTHPAPRPALPSALGALGSSSLVRLPAIWCHLELSPLCSDEQKRGSVDQVAMYCECWQRCREVEGGQCVSGPRQVTGHQAPNPLGRWACEEQAHVPFWPPWVFFSWLRWWQSPGNIKGRAVGSDRCGFGSSSYWLAD